MKKIVAYLKDAYNELIYPVACNVGLRFAIREGGRTVGAGQITELMN